MSALFNHYFFNEPQVISEQEYRHRKSLEEAEWEYITDQTAKEREQPQNRFTLTDGTIIEGGQL